MEIKGDDLLFLFGAGASVDAGIPMSNAMDSENRRIDYRP